MRRNTRVLQVHQKLPFKIIFNTFFGRNPYFITLNWEAYIEDGVAYNRADENDGITDIPTYYFFEFVN